MSSTIRRSRFVWLAALAAAVCPAASATRSPAMTVERVVVLMRHGVRPPTKSPPMPSGTARDPWPAWPVGPGELTPHGAAAIRLLARDDRRWLESKGLWTGRGCPAATDIEALSDSDQRTIATGDVYLETLAPGCRLANIHRPQDQADPLFAAAGERVPLDPARADAAVARALGPSGVAGAEGERRRLLSRLDNILCGGAATACGVLREPSGFAPAGSNRRPRLTGALDRGSTAAQILLLEYAEGKPMAEVGWGRATAADIAALGALHSTEFALLARPPYIAARNIAPIADVMLARLARRDGPRLTLIVGHDTNLASLGGLLDLHWRAPGFAADDPPPGGAMLFELLGDRAGKRFVRASFRSQSLRDMRTLRRRPAYRRTLAIPACGTLCPLDRFRALVTAKLADAGVADVIPAE